MPPLSLPSWAAVPSSSVEPPTKKARVTAAKGPSSWVAVLEAVLEDDLRRLRHQKQTPRLQTVCSGMGTVVLGLEVTRQHVNTAVKFKSRVLLSYACANCKQKI